MFPRLDVFGDEDVGGDGVVVQCLVGSREDVEEGEIFGRLFVALIHCA